MNDIVNHKEALELAYIKRENSNMARSYLELHAEVERLRAELAASKAGTDFAVEVGEEAKELLFKQRDEIERLQAERDDWHKVADARSAEINRLMAELSTVKALLREADAELTLWMYYGHGSKTSGYGSAALLNRIRAALGESE